MRSPDPSLAAAAAKWICVRVTDMSRVDLAIYRFDYDLTFAALLMHGDGTVYHRFGGRDHRDATAWNRLDGLAALLRATVDEHRAHDRDRDRSAAERDHEARHVVDVPWLRERRERDPQLRASCVHCHTVHDALHRQAEADGEASADRQWIHPPPARIGVALDPHDQARIVAVESDSPAAAAGLAVDDRLERVGVQPRVLTLADLQWALHRADPGATELEVSYRRDGELRDATLRLGAGWKRGTVEEYAWRPYKWNLSPAPGFGGTLLDADAQRALGLEPRPFALRVTYLVDWGDRAHRGRAARAAGLRRGDVVLAFAGRDDFADVDTWHAWVRLTRRAGETVEVEVLRGDQRLRLRYRLPA